MFSEELAQYDWNETLERIQSKRPADVETALGKENLTLDDFMALVSPAAAAYIEPMARLSRKYTQERFGKTISMYIPMYITNSCTNSCVYCGFNRHNAIARVILTPEQIELLESYQAAAWRCTEQEERFLFRSGFRLARELSLLPGGLLRL